MNNNQEAEFRDWVSKADYQSLVKAFNNSCGLKREIISVEINRRFESSPKTVEEIESILNNVNLEWAETHTYLQNLHNWLLYHLLQILPCYKDIQKFLIPIS